MGKLMAVNISKGGIPKLPVPGALVTETGLVGDGQEHLKHTKPSRAISLLDLEIIEQLNAEGYPVHPGALGENLTIRDLHGKVAVGDHLRFSGGVEICLSEARKPCFVLDAVDPKMKETTVGRLGWLASVVRPGEIVPGETVEAFTPDSSE
jgi:MOSC domain-containing protein YiiM